jgi:hypothetical protein
MRAALVPLLAAAAASACRGLPPYSPRPYVDLGTEPVVCQKRERAADGRLLRESLCRVENDGTWTLVGDDRAWWPEGGIRWQRSYAEGAPRGVWHSWFPSGLLESRVPVDASLSSGELPVAIWWHPNGLRAAEGPVERGVKQGRWRFWRETGTLSEEGEFADGLQHGQWSQWAADGTLLASGRYERGARVGEWLSAPADGASGSP